MADNNPMDIISGLLSNPNAIAQMGALLKNPPSEAAPLEKKHTPNEALPILPTHEDNGTRLLHALEPFLSSRRRGQIPKLVQAMKIGRMLHDFPKK